MAFFENYPSGKSLTNEEKTILSDAEMKMTKLEEIINLISEKLGNIQSNSNIEETVRIVKDIKIALDEVKGMRFDNIDQINSSMEKLLKTSESLKTNLESNPNLTGYQQLTQNLEENIKNLEALKQTFIEFASTVRNEISSLDNVLNNLNKSIETIKDSFSEIKLNEIDNSAINETINDLVLNFQNFKDNIESINKLHINFDNIVSDNSQTLEKKQQQLYQLQEQVNNLNSSVSEKMDILFNFNNNLDSNKMSENTKNAIDIIINNMEKSKSVLNLFMGEISEKLRQVQENALINVVIDTSNIPSAMKSIEDLNNALKRTQESLLGLGVPVFSPAINPAFSTQTQQQTIQHTAMRTQQDDLDPNRIIMNYGDINSRFPNVSDSNLIDNTLNRIVNMLEQRIPNQPPQSQHPIIRTRQERDINENDYNSLNNPVTRRDVQHYYGFDRAIIDSTRDLHNNIADTENIAIKNYYDLARTQGTGVASKLISNFHDLGPMTDPNRMFDGFLDPSGLNIRNNPKDFTSKILETVDKYKDNNGVIGSINGILNSPSNNDNQKLLDKLLDSSGKQISILQNILEVSIRELENIKNESNKEETKREINEQINLIRTQISNLDSEKDNNADNRRRLHQRNLDIFTSADGLSSREEALNNINKIAFTTIGPRLMNTYSGGLASDAAFNLYNSAKKAQNNINSPYSSLSFGQRFKDNAAVDVDKVVDISSDLFKSIAAFKENSKSVRNDIKKAMESGNEEEFKKEAESVGKLLDTSKVISEEIKKLGPLFRIYSKKELDELSPEVKKILENIGHLVKDFNASNGQLLDIASLFPDGELDEKVNDLRKVNGELDGVSSRIDGISKKSKGFLDQFKDGFKSITNTITAPLGVLGTGLGFLGAGSIPTSINGLLGFKNGVLGDYKTQGRLLADSSQTDLAMGNVYDATAASSRVYDGGLYYQTVSGGRIKAPEFNDSYNKLAQNVGGQYGASDTQTIADLNKINDNTFLLGKVYNINDTTMLNAIQTFYKDLRMSAAETSYTLTNLAETAAAANIPVDKYVATITQLAQQYRSIGVDGKLAINVMDNMIEKGVNADVAQQMAADTGNVIGNASKNPNMLMFAGTMSGQFSDPWEARWASLNDKYDQYGNPDSSGKYAHEITKDIDYMMGLYGSLGGGSEKLTGPILVEQLQKLGFKENESVMLARDYMKGDTHTAEGLITDLLKKQADQKSPEDMQQSLINSQQQLIDKITLTGGQLSELDKIENDLANASWTLAKVSTPLLDTTLGGIRNVLENLIPRLIYGLASLEQTIFNFMNSNFAKNTLNTITEHPLAALGTLAALPLVPKIIGAGVKGIPGLVKSFMPGASEAAAEAGEVVGEAGSGLLGNIGKIGKAALPVAAAGGTIAGLGYLASKFFGGSSEPSTSNSNTSIPMNFGGMNIVGGQQPYQQPTQTTNNTYVTQMLQGYGFSPEQAQMGGNIYQSGGEQAFNQWMTGGGTSSTNGITVIGSARAPLARPAGPYTTQTGLATDPYGNVINNGQGITNAQNQHQPQYSQTPIAEDSTGDYLTRAGIGFGGWQLGYSGVTGKLFGKNLPGYRGMSLPENVYYNASEKLAGGTVTGAETTSSNYIDEALRSRFGATVTEEQAKQILSIAEREGISVEEAAASVLASSEAKSSSKLLQLIGSKPLGTAATRGLGMGVGNVLSEAGIAGYDIYKEHSTGTNVDGSTGNILARAGVNSMYGLVGAGIGTLIGGPVGTVVGAAGGTAIEALINHFTKDENGQGINDRLINGITALATGRSQSDIEREKALISGNGNSVVLSQLKALGYDDQTAQLMIRAMDSHANEIKNMTAEEKLAWANWYAQLVKQGMSDNEAIQTLAKSWNVEDLKKNLIEVNQKLIEDFFAKNGLNPNTIPEQEKDVVENKEKVDKANKERDKKYVDNLKFLAQKYEFDETKTKTQAFEGMAGEEIYKIAFDKKNPYYREANDYLYSLKPEAEKLTNENIDKYVNDNNLNLNNTNVKKQQDLLVQTEDYLKAGFADPDSLKAILQVKINDLTKAFNVSNGEEYNTLKKQIDQVKNEQELIGSDKFKDKFESYTQEYDMLTKVKNQDPEKFKSNQHSGDYEAAGSREQYALLKTINDSAFAAQRAELNDVLKNEQSAIKTIMEQQQKGLTTYLDKVQTALKEMKIVNNTYINMAVGAIDNAVGKDPEAGFKGTKGQFLGDIAQKQASASVGDWSYDIDKYAKSAGLLDKNVKFAWNRQVLDELNDFDGTYTYRPKMNGIRDLQVGDIAYKESNAEGWEHNALGEVKSAGIYVGDGKVMEGGKLHDAKEYDGFSRFKKAQDAYSAAAQKAADTTNKQVKDSQTESDAARKLESNNVKSGIDSASKTNAAGIVDATSKVVSQIQAGTLSQQDGFAQIANMLKLIGQGSGGGGNPSSSNNGPITTDQSNAGKIWNFLANKGFNAGQISGIMGNLKRESELDPKALNRNSGAFGIAQWLGSRERNLASFASQQGKSESDLDVQLQFLWHELQTSEWQTLGALKGVTDPAQAAQIFEQKFERGAGSEIVMGQRIQNAQNYYNQFANGSQGGPEGDIGGPDNVYSGGVFANWWNKITSTFGSARGGPNTKRPNHSGLDIDGQEWDPLNALTTGKVVSLVMDDGGKYDYNKGANSDPSGTVMKIQMGNGQMYEYHHMSSVDPNILAQYFSGNHNIAVNAGQQLGTMGGDPGIAGSGYSTTGSHLHLGYQDANGNYLNPETLLRSLGNGTALPGSTSTPINIPDYVPMSIPNYAIGSGLPTTPTSGASSNYIGYGTVNTQAGVNVRSGPGENDSVIGGLAYGTRIDAIDQINGWDKIMYNGQTGYVANRYIDYTALEKPKTQSDADAALKPIFDKDAYKNPFNTWTLMTNMMGASAYSGQFTNNSQEKFNPFKIMKNILDNGGDTAFNIGSEQNRARDARLSFDAAQGINTFNNPFSATLASDKSGTQYVINSAGKLVPFDSETDYGGPDGKTNTKPQTGFGAVTVGGSSTLNPNLVASAQSSSASPLTNILNNMQSGSASTGSSNTPNYNLNITLDKNAQNDSQFKNVVDQVINLVKSLGAKVTTVETNLNNVQQGLVATNSAVNNNMAVLLHNNKA